MCIRRCPSPVPHAHHKDVGRGYRIQDEDTRGREREKEGGGRRCKIALVAKMIKGWIKNNCIVCHVTFLTSPDRKVNRNTW
jgi:hypothetical protein